MLYHDFPRKKSLLLSEIFKKYIYTFFYLLCSPCKCYDTHNISTAKIHVQGKTLKCFWTEGVWESKHYIMSCRRITFFQANEWECDSVRVCVFICVCFCTCCMWNGSGGGRGESRKRKGVVTYMESLSGKVSETGELEYFFSIFHEKGIWKRFRFLFPLLAFSFWSLFCSFLCSIKVPFFLPSFLRNKYWIV